MTSIAMKKTFTTLGAIAITAFAANAFAGDCPADQRRSDGSGQKMVSTPAKDVTDVVRASTDLAVEAPMLADRKFRLRQLDIKPGGIVPWHSHDERPAMIYIVKGSVTEYASSCAAPIVHNAGDVAAEKRGTSHWWKNTGSEPAVLISVDILHDKAGVDKKTM
jgi:quercetin dioxygenase-like cupin family protein